MRIIGENFREPDAPLTGSLTRGQFLSLFMFLIAAGFLWRAWKNHKRSSLSTRD
jgi:prolipoprotein diacylglyceryltransferase